MARDVPVEVHLYGKLRRLAGSQDTAGDSVARVPVQDGDSIADVLAHLGVPLAETSNLFLNGQLSLPTRPVQPGDRLGVFPNDMSLLYRWYFAKKG
ncbi:MAG: hypothetical protein Q8O40_00510 [Chloroflexota bacterium]|nr:hypothetical protein [Chloroflexota bacterium]